MEKKKTTFVWILLILTGLYLIFEFVGVLMTLINIDKLFDTALLSSPIVNVTSLIFSIGSLAITSIFFVKLYYVKPDVLKWVNISFGYAVISTLIVLVIVSLTYGGLFSLIAQATTIINLIILAVMWFGISSHLKRAQRENLMDFS